MGRRSAAAAATAAAAVAAAATSTASAAAAATSTASAAAAASHPAEPFVGGGARSIVANVGDGDDAIYAGCMPSRAA